MVIHVKMVLTEDGHDFTLPRTVGRLQEFLNERVDIGLEGMAQFLKRAIKRRVPVLTGNLRRQLKIKALIRGRSKRILVSTSDKATYAIFQEIGYTPHYIPFEYIGQHRNNPGARGERVVNPSSYLVVSKHTPFVIPSLKALRNNMGRIQSRAFKKALKKSKKVRSKRVIE